MRATLLIASCLITAGCSQEPPSKVTAAAPPSPFLPTASIQEIMQSVIDPAADALWASVATISTEKGIEERQPRTDEEWAEVRRKAVIVIEASNLLVMQGRRVVAEGKALEDAHIESNLTSEQIQKLIDSDHATFTEKAHGLHSAGIAVLAAIDARNVEALSESGGALDEACESCHMKYWYPNSPQPGNPK